MTFGKNSEFFQDEIGLLTKRRKENIRFFYLFLPERKEDSLDKHRRLFHSSGKAAHRMRSAF
jgi:hypothetical protein